MFCLLTFFKVPTKLNQSAHNNVLKKREKRGKRTEWKRKVSKEKRRKDEEESWLCYLLWGGVVWTFFKVPTKLTQSAHNNVRHCGGKSKEKKKLWKKRRKTGKWRKEWSQNKGEQNWEKRKEKKNLFFLPICLFFLLIFTRKHYNLQSHLPLSLQQ